MTGSSGGSGTQGSSSSERLPAVFVGILIVEALAIATLYWLGVHFA